MLSVAHVAMTATTVAPLAPVNVWMLMSSDQKAKGRLTALRDGILSPEADEASVRQRLQDADQHAVAVELSEEPDWWTRVTSGEGTCVISLKSDTSRTLPPASSAGEVADLLVVTLPDAITVCREWRLGT